MMEQNNFRIVATAALACLICSLGCQRVVPTKRPAKAKTLQQWAEIAAAPLEPNHFVDVHHRFARAKQKRRDAFEQMRSFDAAAIPVLIKVAENGNPRDTARAIKILGWIGPEANSAVPTALQMLESGHYDARAEAAAALGAFGVSDRNIVQALVDSCENEKARPDQLGRPRRPGANRGPGSGGGRSMRSELPEGTLRANVAVSLGRLASHPDLSIPMLVKMLDLQFMQRSQGCDAAAESLGAFGSDARMAIPALVENLRSRPYTQPTLTALRRIDPGLTGTISVLISNLSSDNNGIKQHAVLVLALLQDEPAVPAIISAIRRGDFGTVGALKHLQKIDLKASTDLGESP